MFCAHNPRGLITETCPAMSAANTGATQTQPSAPPPSWVTSGQEGSVDLGGGRRMVQGASYIWYTRERGRRHHSTFSPCFSSPVDSPCPPQEFTRAGGSWKRHGAFIIYDDGQREKAANTSKACTIIYTSYFLHHHKKKKKNPCIHI